MVSTYLEKMMNTVGKLYTLFWRGWLLYVIYSFCVGNFTWKLIPILIFGMCCWMICGLILDLSIELLSTIGL